MRRGIAEGLPYSLSRWTDLPAAKWDWFKDQLSAGSMVAMDPATGMPDRWSLDPADTLGMIFWTRNCRNLLLESSSISAYRKVVHFTLTGWHEVERRAPGIEEGLELLGSAVETFGVDNVTWRFSPVPLVEDIVQRFTRLAAKVESFGLDRVYLSFLQQNDWMQETRTGEQRRELLARLAASTSLLLVLCNEDQETLAPSQSLRLRSGICEDGSRFYPQGKREGCGCALAVDPFSMNEACSMGCKFCYSANIASSPKKRNTTKLMVIREPKA